MINQNMLSLFENEHPQIAALLLIMLPSHIAGMILSQLPVSIALELAERMITTENIDTGALEKVASKLHHEFNIAVERLSINKNDVVIEILLHTEYMRRREIILDLRETKGIALSYPSVLIIEDITKLDCSLLCSVLSKIHIGEVLTILRIAPEEIKDKILSCYPEETAREIKSDLDWAGAVSIDTIAQTCQKVVTIINNKILYG